MIRVGTIGCDYGRVVHLPARRLLEGQYNSPVRVIGFNVAEGWVRDVSEDVARVP